MILKKVLIYYFVSIITAFCSATETLTLQNGLEGYTGCSDTYIKSIGNGIDFPFQFRDSNYVNDTAIITAN